MVVAKSDRAYRELKRQFHDREVTKIYHAVVQGHPDPLAGTIDAPIGRHPVHRTRMAIVAGGKAAVTHYRVRESFPSHTLLECDLETGRTHQIRVHLASIGHPLEGDPVYAKRAAGPASARKDAAFARQALHAWKLAFVHPRSAAPQSFEAPAPEDLRALLESLRR